jgi:hypothetical protein
VPGTCGSAGTPPQLSNSPAGSCLQDLYKGNSDGLDLKYVAPAASGGACTSSGQPTGTLTYGGNDRSCAPDSAPSAGCSGDQCTPDLPSPYLACVVQPGSVSCPSGSVFSVQHVVGTSGTLACGACGCGVDATCSGKVALFTDPGCTQGEMDFATGQCLAGPTGGGLGGTSFGSYKYEANPPAAVSCAASGSSQASVTLVSEETICCPQ